ncbi:MAG TPA: class F sortase [Ktedonobacteraceae bacterium]
MSRQSTTARQSAFYTLLLTLCLGLLACSPTDTARLAVSNPTITPTGPASTASAAPASSIHPDRLLIPAIQVNAPIEAVGIDRNGDLATPTRNPWEDTGWYADGPLPGTQGSAVIDGHLDRPGGSPAVFWLLRQLRAGDMVKVHVSNGATLRFQVTDVEYYEPQNAPLQQIFGDSSGIYLNLITCAGDWIPNQHQTKLRLVVYTRLISSH